MAGSSRRRPGPGRLHFEIPTDCRESRKAQFRVLNELVRRGYSNDSLFAIRLAMEEALVNAMKHGNHFDPAKKIIIDARIGPRSARIAVEDQGAGFDRRHVGDPTRAINLCKLHGRGIFLIKAYMDQARWTQGGRRVTMTKANA
jgi:serine/threonine-protein kinase RsbW